MTEEVMTETHKKIKVTYSSTNEKSIDEVIQHLIEVHENKQEINVKKAT